MKPISQKVIHQIFAEIDASSLSGKWVLVGGSLLHYLGFEVRVTEDIDFANAGNESNQNDLLSLFSIAEKVGLPVEVINQAATFFLKKHSGWEKMLVEIYKGKRATVYRPNATLFLLMKIQRMSESDCIDCLYFLDYATSIKERVKKAVVSKAIEIRIDDDNTSADVKKRLKKLLAALS